MFDVVVAFDSAVVVALNVPIKIKLCMLSLLDYLHDRMILSPNQINRVCSPYWIIYTYGVICISYLDQTVYALPIGLSTRMVWSMFPI